MRNVIALALFVCALGVALPLRADDQCHYDYMTCGSQWAENLANATCRFIDSPLKYMTWYIDLAVGTTVNVTVSSTAFPPHVLLYRDDDEAPIAEAKSATRARLSYSVTRSERYWIVITTADPNRRSGIFELDIACNSQCVKPTIFSGVQTSRVPYGDQVRVRVEADGTPRLRFRWFDEANPSVTLSTDYMSFITLPMQAAATFGVQVTNSCGSVTQTVATVAVDPCTAPSITLQPVSASVTSGAPATFTVIAAGTDPLTTLWYEGERGDTRSYSGFGPTLTVQKATRTTSYWARVSNACGFADSQPARLTVVESSRRRAVRH